MLQPAEYNYIQGTVINPLYNRKGYIRWSNVFAFVDLATDKGPSHLKINTCSTGGFFDTFIQLWTDYLV